MAITKTVTKIREYTVAGTHQLNVPKTAEATVEIRGAGGGNAFAYYNNGEGGIWYTTGYGGKGGIVTGNTTLEAGEYEIIVGAAGAYSEQRNNGRWASGGTGGSSSAFGNTASGGTGGSAQADNGNQQGYNGSNGGTSVASDEFTGVTGGGSNSQESGYVKVTLTYEVVVTDYKFKTLKYYIYYIDEPTIACYYARKITTRKYYKQTVYEYTTAGTNEITIPDNSITNVLLIGGGGGFNASSWHTDRWYCATAGGGSGAKITGNLILPQGTYTITVGANGQATSLNDLLVAGAGGNAASYQYSVSAGTGGTATISASVQQISLTAINGNKGSATGGAIGYCPAVYGGKSSYDDTYIGYGAGGSYGVAGGNNAGYSGYAKIIVTAETTEDDYDFYKDTDKYYILLERRR